MSPRQRVGGSHLQSGGECRQIKRPKRGPVIGLGAKYFNTDSNFKGLATGQRPSVSLTRSASRLHLEFCYSSGRQRQRLNSLWPQGRERSSSSPSSPSPALLCARKTAKEAKAPAGPPPRSGGFHCDTECRNYFALVITSRCSPSFSSFNDDAQRSPNSEKTAHLTNQLSMAPNMELVSSDERKDAPAASSVLLSHQKM